MLLENGETRRFGLFLAVGAVNTLVGYTLFALLILLGAGSVAAVIGATILGALFNFRSIGSVVFGRGEVRLLPRFLAVYGIQCVMNIALLRLAERQGASPLLAQAPILPVLAVAVYLMMRRFVFSPTPSADGR